MAKMNWSRVKSETSMARYGWHRAEETYQPATAKKKKKKRSRKEKSFVAGRASTTSHEIISKEKRRLAHEARIRKGREETVKAQDARERKRLVHEARIRKQQEEAAATRETKRREHEAKIAAARKAREADPLYQAKKAAERLAHEERRRARLHREASLDHVVVVRKMGRRDVVSKLQARSAPAPAPTKQE